jgi:hypothetical protein
MGVSAQIVSNDGGFDRAAAEAYLQELHGCAALRQTAKVIRHRPGGASLMKPVARTPARNASRRSAGRRTWTAAATAITAPVAIGLALAFWTTSKPIAPEPDPTAVSGTLRESTQARPAVNAYSVTTPVPADEPAADAQATIVASVHAGPTDTQPAHARYLRGSTRASARSAAVSAPIDEAAPDFPSYGILDPAPATASGRPADTVTAN